MSVHLPDDVLDELPNCSAQSRGLAAAKGRTKEKTSSIKILKGIVKSISTERVDEMAVSIHV